MERASDRVIRRVCFTITSQKGDTRIWMFVFKPDAMEYSMTVIIYPSYPAQDARSCLMVISLVGMVPRGSLSIWSRYIAQHGLCSIARSRALSFTISPFKNYARHLRHSSRSCTRRVRKGAKISFSAADRLLGDT